MFDLGWDEMAIIAVLALVVLGPKELPNALRTISMLMKNARKLAGEFQSGVNDIIREADLDEARKKLAEVQSLNKNSIQNAIEKAVDPTGEMKTAIKEATNVDATAAAKPAEPAMALNAPSVEVPAAAATGDASMGHAIEVAAAGDAPTLPAATQVTQEPESPDNTPAPEPVAAAKS